MASVPPADTVFAHRGQQMVVTWRLNDTDDGDVGFVRLALAYRYETSDSQRAFKSLSYGCYADAKLSLMVPVDVPNGPAVIQWVRFGGDPNGVDLYSCSDIWVYGGQPFSDDNNSSDVPVFISSDGVCPYVNINQAEVCTGYSSGCGVSNGKILTSRPVKAPNDPAPDYRTVLTSNPMCEKNGNGTSVKCVLDCCSVYLSCDESGVGSALTTSRDDFVCEMHNLSNLNSTSCTQNVCEWSPVPVDSTSTSCSSAPEGLLVCLSSCEVAVCKDKQVAGAVKLKPQFSCSNGIIYPSPSLCDY
eukprot:TRINITY_DN12977_c0_g1_i1.p1 TRINITY_DN12977_c0_g1~~TRINITY_DN12977_c0_g1_i1.p1  ORF type:complete len:310 (-),score=47.18 TRINITY_DN12977_c0_g1_i1:25-927(-)